MAMPPSNNGSSVLVFVKAPEKGKVKSRLAAAIGEEATLGLYTCFVSDVLETVKRGPYPFRVFFYPDDAKDALTRWIGSAALCASQRGGDLGDRMKNAFIRSFSEGSSKALLIGSDIPDLPESVIDEAFLALKTNDAVIGPAEDGGYYLIGFNKSAFLSEVFDNIEWSTPRVFEKTMAAFGRRGCRVHLLPRWRDVDTIEDLQALAERNKDTAFAASRTMAYLREALTDIRY